MSTEVNGSPLLRTIEQNSVTYERMLLTCCLRSYRFYLTKKQLLCPYDPERGQWRQDFSLRRFNLVYAVMDTIYTLYQGMQITSDFSLDKDLLQLTIIDWVNNGKIPSEEYADIEHEIKNDFYAGSLDASFFTAVGGEPFSYWLDLRLTGALVKSLANQGQLQFMTVDQVKEQVEKSRQLMASASGNYVNAGALMLGTRRYENRIRMPLKCLNRRMAGGLGRDEATMIAGANGGGKTILAMQFVSCFANQDENVVCFTTEQKPEELILRSVSDYVGVPFDQLITRADAPSIIQKGEVLHLPTLPTWLWTDPNYSQKTRLLLNMLSTRVVMINWAEGQGYTIEKHFDREIEALDALGWRTDVAVFDWLGGALRKETPKDQRRHIYESGAEHMIGFTKRRRIPTVIMVQADKDAVKGKKAVKMDMVSECKTMTNNISNFLGLSFLSASEERESDTRMQARQFINVDKCRKGSGGLAAVEAAFKFQRFMDVPEDMIGGAPQPALPMAPPSTPPPAPPGA